MDSFYTTEEIAKFGLKKAGKNIKISRNTCIYGAENISIGDYVRIDDFCRLSGNITIGNYVHISSYSGLWGGEEGIIIEDFVNISSRVSIFAQSDDYSGIAMTGPLIPDEYKIIISKQVVIRKHTIIGSTSVILPGVITGEGTACGALSMISKNTEPWGIYGGIPAKKLKCRKKELLEKEFQYFHHL